MSNDEPSSNSARRSRRIAGLNPSTSELRRNDNEEETEESGLRSENSALALQNQNSADQANREGNQDMWGSSLCSNTTEESQSTSASTLSVNQGAAANQPSPLAGQGDLTAGLSSFACSSAGRAARGRECSRCRLSHPLRSQLGILRSTFPESSNSEPFPVRGESFCSCTQLSQRRELQCSCGEEDTVFEWDWDVRSKSSACDLTDDRREVHFHVNYSSGTAAARGSHAMTDRQHFWEIKMTTPVYGTDMMVGVGTETADLDAYRYNFCSLLGRDAESWGLSYYGRLHHKGNIIQLQGSRFGQGSIIGVHLDMWRGILSFYKNRRPLGVGYTGLSGKVLYPMVSSTAARTGMRLIKACSFQTSLQFLCCQVLREIIPSHLDVINELKLPPGLQAFLTNNLSWLLRPNELSETMVLSQRHDASLRKRSWSRRFPMETASSSDEDDAVHSVRGSSRYKRRRKEGYLRTERPQVEEEEEYENPSSSEESSRDNAPPCGGGQSGSQHLRS